MTSSETDRIALESLGQTLLTRSSIFCMLSPGHRQNILAAVPETRSPFLPQGISGWQITAALTASNQLTRGNCLKMSSKETTWKRTKTQGIRAALDYVLAHSRVTHARGFQGKSHHPSKLPSNAQAAACCHTVIVPTLEVNGSITITTD